MASITGFTRTVAVINGPCRFGGKPLRIVKKGDFRVSIHALSVQSANCLVQRANFCPSETDTLHTAPVVSWRPFFPGPGVVAVAFPGSAEAGRGKATAFLDYAGCPSPEADGAPLCGYPRPDESGSDAPKTDPR